MKKLNIASLLEADLTRIGLTQRALLLRLTADGEKQLTEQALSSWKLRNKIPKTRLPGLLDILGPLSELAKAYSSSRPVSTAPAIESDRLMEIIKALPQANRKQIMLIERALGLDLV